jgi:hypothetical protein
MTTKTRAGLATSTQLTAAFLRLQVLPLLQYLEPFGGYSIGYHTRDLFLRLERSALASVVFVEDSVGTSDLKILARHYVSFLGYGMFKVVPLNFKLKVMFDIT